MREGARNEVCENVGRSRQQSLAFESKLDVELNIVEANAVKLEKSLDVSPDRLRGLEGELTRLKAAQTGEVRDATRRTAADQSVLLDALQ